MKNATALTGRGLMRNTLAAVAVKVTSPASMLVVVVAIAHLRTPSVLGEYTFLLLLVQLAELLKCLGLNTMVLRESAKSPADALRWWRSLLRIGNCNCAIAAPVLLGIAAVSGQGHVPATTLLASIALWPGLIASSYVIANEAVFFGLGRVPELALVTGIECGTRAVASVLALFLLHVSVVGLVSIYSLTRVLSAVVGGILRRRLNLAELPYDRALTLSMLRGAVPFLTVFVMPLVLFRIDVLVLGITASAAEVGTYSAASRLFTLALLLPDGAMTTLFASYSQAVAANMNRFQQLVLNACKSMVSLATLIGVAAYALAPIAIRILFGRQFESSAPLFRILIWALPLFAFSRSLGDGLVALGRQAMAAWLVVFTTLSSIAVYAFLVSRFHSEGAAIGFISSAAILASSTGIAFWYVRRLRPYKILAAAMPVLIALAVVALCGREGTRLTLLLIVSVVPLVVVLRMILKMRLDWKTPRTAEAEGS